MTLWDNLDDSAKEALQKACDEQGLTVEAALDVGNRITSIVVDAFNCMVEVFNCLAEDLAEAYRQMSINPDSPGLAESLMEGWDHVPPKVRHLAFHHHKRRVRNKNWNRMWKTHGRYMK